jgi:nickel-dependent lactate racemase
MTKVSFPFGSDKLQLDIPDRNLLGILDAKSVSGTGNPVQMVMDAVTKPIGTPPLTEIAEKGQTAAIVVDDHTRGLPCAILVNPLLQQLQASGVREEDVTIIFGTGTHRATTPEEQKRLLNDVSCQKHRVVVHNCDADDQVHVGKTSYDTEVEISRIFHDADLHLLTGDVGYHYYAGFGGGRKSILPAVSSRKTINKNHGMLTHPKSITGNLAGNPVHLDMVEAARLARVDFIVNFVRNSQKEIIAAFAGDLEQAWQKGTKLVDKYGRVPIKERANIVIVSSGFPKDIDLYQAYKATDNALHAVKKNGVIINLLECREGIGHKVFEQWAHDYKTLEELDHQIRTNFIMGGHKSYYLARASKQADLFLVSTLNPQEVKEYYHMTPFKTAKDALVAALERVGHDATVWAMPHATEVLPSTSN